MEAWTSDILAAYEESKNNWGKVNYYGKNDNRTVKRKRNWKIGKI